VTWGLFAQRFILAMHYSAHRTLISSRTFGRLFAGIANAIPQVILANFFGMPAGCYYLHHCVMHHQANNFFPYDISSTMPYKRDSPIQFLAYVLNFCMHTLLYLPYYAVRKKRYGIAVGTVLTSVGYVATYVKLSAIAPVFFTTSLGVSALLGPFMLMLGNFSQHIFVDPERPTSNYALACNHVAAPFNMLTFNDGYHITHHVSSIIHWADMPRHFIEHLDAYEKGGAIIFEGIDFNDITINAWRGEKGLAWLAKRIVQITPEKLTEKELIEMMRARLQPVRNEKTQLDGPQIAVSLVNEVIWYFLYLLGFPYAFYVVCLTPLFHAIVYFA